MIVKTHQENDRGRVSAADQMGVEFTTRNETMNKKLLMNGLFAAGLMATMPLSFAQAQSMAISQMPIADIVATLKSEGRVSMSGALFESNNHKLTGSAGDVVAKLAESLKQLPDAKLAIVGHSDSTGDFAYNVDLSARRAQSVIEALVSNHGIKRARLVGLGAGPIDPLATNSTADGRSLNRRVSFIIISEAKPNATAADSGPEAGAKKLLKAMSDYMAAQQSISFDFNATLGIVTNDEQNLELASSGNISINRPGKIRATRAGGHADVVMLYDGETLTLSGNGANIYSQIKMTGSIDNMINVLRDDYDRPIPAADLIMTNTYEQLMEGVTNVKDLGSGVIGGVECDYLAFRKEKIDWQIWIAQGLDPYPCQYVVTSKDIPHSPQYTIQVRNWMTGVAVPSDYFDFKNPTNATKVEIDDLRGMSALPDHFKEGANQ
jgi:hypothetical protein